MNMPEFKGATCKGSYVFGTACGHCERCTWERENNPSVVLDRPKFPGNWPTTSLTDLERRVERMEQLWVDFLEHMAGRDRSRDVEIGIQAIFHEMVERSVPVFHLPVLSIPYALGISTLAATAVQTGFPAQQKVEWWSRMVAGIMVPFFTLAIAWIVHLWC